MDCARQERSWMELVEVELKPVDMHWLEEGDPHDDCCVHGRVILRLGERIISDRESEWTLSTAAFRLLGTLNNDHAANIDEPLIPCCGFNMWPEEGATDGLYIPNCNEGIEWTIKHPETDIVAHILADGETFYTDFSTWSASVCAFSDQIYDFFQTAWPKNHYHDEDRQGFEMFMKLWKERRDAAEPINEGRDDN